MAATRTRPSISCSATTVSAGSSGSSASTAAGGGGGGGGANFGGTAGILRLFNAEWAGQIAWLLPFAAVALVGGLWFRRRAGRADPGVAAYLLWGSWLFVTAAVFSFMSGTVHPYYAVALAPAIAALVGGGAVDMWKLRERSRFGGLPLAAAILATVLVAVALLARTPDFLPGLDVAIIAVGVAAAVVVAVPASLVSRRAALVVAAAGLAVVMAAPDCVRLRHHGHRLHGIYPVRRAPAWGERLRRSSRPAVSAAPDSPTVARRQRHAADRHASEWKPSGTACRGRPVPPPGSVTAASAVATGAGRSTRRSSTTWWRTAAPRPGSSR